MGIHRTFHYRLFAIATIFVSAAGAAAAEQPVPPEGWRYPAAAEVAGPWRAEHEGRYLSVTGDFDGDGETDTATVLFAERAGPRGLPAAIGIFAWLSGASGGEAQAVGVIEYPLPVDFEQVAIESVPPGRYVTACGAGYGEACTPGEPAEFVLINDGIRCCLSESVAGIYWWDPETHRFDGLPTSD